MSTQFFLPNPISQQRLRVGPLAADLDGFATRLKAEGYARKSAMIKLRLVGHLSRWLQHQGLDIEALDEPRIDAFLLARGPGSVRQGDGKTVRQLLAHLRANGRLPPIPSSADNATPVAPVNGGENPDQGAEQNQTTGGERFRCIEGLRGAVWRSASGNAARA